MTHESLTPQSTEHSKPFPVWCSISAAVWQATQRGQQTERTWIAFIHSLWLYFSNQKLSCFSVYGKNTHTPHLHHSTLKRGLNIIAHLPSPRDRFPWSRTSSSLHPWAGSWRRGCCSRRSKSRRRPACRGAWRWSRREGKGSTSRWRRTRGSPSRRRWTVSTLRGPWRSPLLLSMK